MYRFFSTAVLLNWLAAMAFIALSGFGLGEEGGGLVKAFGAAITNPALFGFHERMAEIIAMMFALAGLTAGLWAILALAVADDSEAQQKDQDFVVATSLGVCLLLLMPALMLAAWGGDVAMGTLACVASFITVLAGVAHRMFAVAEISERAPQQPMQTLSEKTARSMASQSASLAMSGARTNRFIPKQTYVPNRTGDAT